jgi:hypothetical protein
MIVLDEELQGLGLEESISGWYRGSVILIKTLRPGTVIKDDVIPSLLRNVKQPTFVTINTPDFWRRIAPENSFCIVCLKLTTDQTEAVSNYLRQLFKLSEFKTKRKRMGKIVMASSRGIQYYGGDKMVHIAGWPAVGRK